MHSRGIISILGCGWLGTPLAQSLISSGYRVKGSTTSTEKLVQLKNKGIESYLVQFGDSQASIDKEFLNADTLIVSVPPGRKHASGAENYRTMIRYFAENLPHSQVKKLILISSTSVYGDHNIDRTENDPADADTDSGKLLAESEQELLKLKSPCVIILRPGGLIGPGRHPSRFFAGKQEIPNGLAEVNLIHLEDVIGIIQSLIQDDKAHGIYNACAPQHPSKTEFYTLAAQRSGLPLPGFMPEKKAWKIINSTRVKEELGYNYIFPDLLHWVSNHPPE